MEFIDALDCLYYNRASDEEFADPFLLYCRLSDLCGASFEDKRKVLLFYQVNKKLNMVGSILSKDETILTKHEEVAGLLSKKSFNNLVKSVKEVIFPEQKQEETLKPPPQNKVVQKVVVTKTEEPQEEETRTPLTSSYVGGGDTDVIISLMIIGGVILAAALFVLLACIFKWPWIVWQWFVGIIGGLLLHVIITVIIVWLEDKTLCEYNVLGTYILGATVLINFILLLVFKHNYKVIFGWVTGYGLIGGVALALITFDETKNTWGIAQIIEIALSIILFIIAMTCI